MSIELLAAAAVTAIAPLAAKAIDSAAEKVGELTVETAAKVADWLRVKLTGRARESLERLEAEPTNARRAGALQDDLIELLTAEPVLLAELQQLIPPPTINTVQSLNINGDGNKIAQVSGQNNNVSIS